MGWVNEDMVAMLPCSPMRTRWDIFCRVVDNFGDIGVCWRLARQLAGEHGLAVRLWVDDLASLTTLCPGIDSEAEQQQFSGVDIRRWREPFAEVAPAAVVIEAFACELPASYVLAMSRCAVPPVWINLEYLSAESWIEGCHALASPHPSLPLRKHFFFPGFTAQSGGLLCERGLFVAREAFQSALPARDGLEVSLFCYDTAPVGALLTAWAASQQPIRCRVAAGMPTAAVAAYLGGQGPWQIGPLRIEPIPFLSQDDYDRLLWSCDLNFVRGEDSFLRAQWAGRPFVWQIYPQEAGVHLEKLDAFLARYRQGLPAASQMATDAFFHAWNTGNSVAAAWEDFAPQLPVLRTHAVLWAEQLAANGDLAGNLLKFCANQL